MKFSFWIFICICFLSLFNISFATYDINAISNKEYSIIYNDEQKSFYDATGSSVYPILYEGTNYLPIRAVSSLFGIEIKWDGQNNCVFLGSGEIDKVASKTNNNINNEKNENIVAIVNEDIKVYYNGTLQNFSKQVGDSREKVYPLSYKGTTYLPIRNITELFDGIIEWDGTNKTIKIESKDYFAEKSKIENDIGPLYNIGNDYVYNNGDIYFRIYEPSDFEKDFTSQMSHDYKNVPGDRKIAKIETSNGKTDINVLFSNDSRGKFYFVDKIFFFSNGNEIYTTDLNGNKLKSFGKANFKKLDADNHKFELYKDDGIYEINTLTLAETKIAELHYDYTLEKINEEFFGKNMKEQWLTQLYKDEEFLYYYFLTNDTFEIYSFSYITKENKKYASISNIIHYEYDYSEKLMYVDFLAKYENKIYVYAYNIAGTIGTTNGIIYTIDNNQNIKVLLETFADFVNYEAKDDLLYLTISGPAGEFEQYAIHMDTTSISIVEGYIQNYENDKSAEVAEMLMKNYLTSDKQEELKATFKAEEVMKTLNETRYTGNAYNPYLQDNIWEEILIKPTQRYDYGHLYIYEYNVAIHGYVSWRGEYHRVGVVYFLVDTARNTVQTLYTVEL